MKYFSIEERAACQLFYLNVRVQYCYSKVLMLVLAAELLFQSAEQTVSLNCLSLSHSCKRNTSEYRKWCL